MWVCLKEFIDELKEEVNYEELKEIIFNLILI